MLYRCSLFTVYHLKGNSAISQPVVFPIKVSIMTPWLRLYVCVCLQLDNMAILDGYFLCLLSVRDSETSV